MRVHYLLGLTIGPDGDHELTVVRTADLEKLYQGVTGSVRGTLNNALDQITRDVDRLSGIKRRAVVDNPQG